MAVGQAPVADQSPALAAPAQLARHRLLGDQAEAPVEELLLAADRVGIEPGVGQLAFERRPGQRAGQGLGRRQQRIPLLVGQHDAPGRVADGDAGGQAFEGRAQQRIGAPRGQLCSQGLGHDAAAAAVAREMAVEVEGRCAAEGHGDPATRRVGVADRIVECAALAPGLLEAVPARARLVVARAVQLAQRQPQQRLGVKAQVQRGVVGDPGQHAPGVGLPEPVGAGAAGVAQALLAQLGLALCLAALQQRRGQQRQVVQAGQQTGLPVGPGPRIDHRQRTHRQPVDMHRHAGIGPPRRQSALGPRRLLAQQPGIGGDDLGAGAVRTRQCGRGDAVRGLGPEMPGGHEVQARAIGSGQLRSAAHQRVEGRLGPGVEHRDRFELAQPQDFLAVQQGRAGRHRGVVGQSSHGRQCAAAAPGTPPCSTSKRTTVGLRSSGEAPSPIAPWPCRAQVPRRSGSTSPSPPKRT